MHYRRHNTYRPKKEFEENVRRYPGIPAAEQANDFLGQHIFDSASFFIADADYSARRSGNRRGLYNAIGPVMPTRPPLADREWRAHRFSLIEVVSVELQ